jgi:hypothetical protein
MGHPLSLDRLHKNNLSKKNNTIFFGLQLIFVFVYLVHLSKTILSFLSLLVLPFEGVTRRFATEDGKTKNAKKERKSE